MTSWHKYTQPKNSPPAPREAQRSAARPYTPTFLAANERASRLASHIRRIETRLSEALGEDVWRSTGLGAPQDLDELNQRITMLEQQKLDL